MIFNTKTVEAGAATSVWAATLSVKEGKGGLYLDQISKQINNTGEIIKQMFCLYQLAHAINACTWNIGGFAARSKFQSLLLFSQSELCDLFFNIQFLCMCTNHNYLDFNLKG